MTDRDLHTLLEEWGFRHKPTRINGGDPRRVWHLDLTTLCEVEEKVRAAMQPSHLPEGGYSDYTAKR